MVRWSLGGIGVLAGLWGVWLLVPLLPDAVSLLVWFGGGVVLHDALAAPLVALTGLVIARWVPALWRTPVAVGLVLSAVLLLLATPLLLRPAADVVNPGLHDRNYPLGLAVAVLLLWTVVAAVGIMRELRRDS